MLRIISTFLRQHGFAMWLSAMLLLTSLAASAQITPGTACGAPGTGYVQDHYGRPVMQTRNAAQAKSTKVNASGYWEACEMPPPKVWLGCSLPQEFRWVAQGRRCEGQGRTVKHGQILTVIAPNGVWSGQCVDGALNQLVSTCEQPKDCTASNYRATEDGGVTWWTWQGRLKDGERGQAVNGSGAVRGLVCEAGRLRLQ